MRTKEYDVNLTGRRLSIVRLKDGAVVAEAEIPAEATDAVVEVLTASDQREREYRRERKLATKAPSAPVEATDAVVEVLTAKEDASPKVETPTVESKPKKTTSSRKSTGKKTNDDEPV